MKLLRVMMIVVLMANGSDYLSGPTRRTNKGP